MMDLSPDTFSYKKYCEKYRKQHGAFNRYLEKAIANRILSPKQVEIIQDISLMADKLPKVLLLLGATRSGKTHASAFLFVILMYLTKDSPGDIAIAVRDSRSYFRNLHPALVKVIGSHRITIKTLERHGYITIGNTKCFILAYFSSEFTAKIRGATFRGVYVDELSQTSALIYHEIQTRLTSLNSWLLCTSNASVPSHWMQKEIINPPEYLAHMFKVVNFSLNDNPMMTDEEKLKYAMYISGDELSFRRFILGEWVEMQGLVYNFMAESHIIASKPNEKPEGYLIGVDWGSYNPSAAILIGYNRSSQYKIWIEDEIYHDYRSKNYRLSPSDLAFEINKKWGHLKYLDTEVYVDPSAPILADEILRFDFNICEADNHVLSGIHSVSNMLNMGSLFVLSGCQHTLAEFQSYQWDIGVRQENTSAYGSREETDKVLKKNDHCMDAIRYALHSRFPSRLGDDPFNTENNEENKLATSPHYRHIKKFMKGEPLSHFTTKNPKEAFF